jgi:hypothetical protein
VILGIRPPNRVDLVEEQRRPISVDLAENDGLGGRDHLPRTRDEQLEDVEEPALAAPPRRGRDRKIGARLEGGEGVRMDDPKRDGDGLGRLHGNETGDEAG